eukprot:CAMPEP_0177697450 /NCGR_PEP_ID=MMETSP0484_2-20121128/4521_1 /TAXON_ID=354590 /ORGANISM="Rhodomonas lens, Strain RHODO" /LENGTH=140 /DNA_ID=CAMNT_0019208491 /DNA_START=582 /DNA_END=1004 /DNA_ORIENTATION=+
MHHDGHQRVARAPSSRRGFSRLSCALCGGLWLVESLEERRHVERQPEPHGRPVLAEPRKRRQNSAEVQAENPWGPRHTQAPMYTPCLSLPYYLLAPLPYGLWDGEYGGSRGRGHGLHHLDVAVYRSDQFGLAPHRHRNAV